MKRLIRVLAGLLFIFMMGFLFPSSVKAAGPSEQLEGLETLGLDIALGMMEPECASPANETIRRECDAYYDAICLQYGSQIPSQYQYHCGNFFVLIWNQYRVTILIGLAGIAILIGMILYDRAQKRGSGGRNSAPRRFGSAPQGRSLFSFDDDDRDENIFQSGYPERAPRAERRDFDRDGGNFHRDDFGRSEDFSPRGGEVNRWGDSGEVSLPKRAGGGDGLYLRGIEGDFAGQSIPLSKDTITIGRSRECNLVMRNYIKGVSKMHCAVRFSASRKRYQIMDLGSSYGTYLNGVKLGAKTPHDLKKGDTIYLGSKKVGFRMTD